jgi:hypothetical protein
MSKAARASRRVESSVGSGDAYAGVWILVIKR